MKKIPLNDHLINYYNDKRLAQGKLVYLRGMTEQKERLKKNRAISSMHRLVLQIFYAASGILLILFLMAGIYRFFHVSQSASADNASELSTAIAFEIAQSHSKNPGIDFRGPVDALIKQMDQLTFTLITPKWINPSVMKVVGARYCSLQGRPSALLQLISFEGTVYTLYQTPLDPKLTSITNQTIHQGPLQVTFWQEKGVFLALARPCDSNSAEL